MTTTFSTIAFAALKTWNRYWSGGVAVNGAVEALTTRTAGPVDGLTPPTGDCTTGADTFNVASDAGVTVAGGVGVRGVLEFDVHARVNPSSTVTPVTAIKFRDINSSRNELNRPGGLCCVFYA